VIHEGQIVLFAFPFSQSSDAKLRPAPVLRRLPGRHDDWLICMISSQLDQGVLQFDEAVLMTDPDFATSGLRVASAIRIARVAVVAPARLAGSLGDVAPERLARILDRLAGWLRPP
jgi:mRNA-degrading endonuclease toxin of MazEF toxin-antitoxin module